MTAVVWTDVVDEASELAAGVSAGAQTAILDFVNTKLVTVGLDGDVGRKTFLARVFLAAHMATLLKRKGQPGSASSKSSGGVSVSYTLPQLTRLGAYATTSYGLLYASIVGASAHRAGLLLGSS